MGGNCPKIALNHKNNFSRQGLSLDNFFPTFLSELSLEEIFKFQGQSFAKNVIPSIYHSIENKLCRQQLSLKKNCLGKSFLNPRATDNGHVLRNFFPNLNGHDSIMVRSFGIYGEQFRYYFLQDNSFQIQFMSKNTFRDHFFA